MDAIFATNYRTIVNNSAVTEKQRLDDLSGLFRSVVDSERGYTPQESSLLDGKWKAIRHQACQNAGLGGWGTDLLGLSDQQIGRIREAFARIVAGVEAQGFDPFRGIERLSHLQNLMRHFLQDVEGSDSVYSRMTSEELRAIFVSHNPRLIAQVRAEISSMFQRIHTQIEEGGHDPKTTEMFVGHLIGLVAFLDPPNGSTLEILQKIDGHWQMIDYRVERLMLTNPTLTTPVWATGLSPVNHPQAAPLLLFHGTAPRTTSGALLCYMSDLTPVLSVGEMIFLAGKEAIAGWMAAQPQGRQVEVYGISLGGSLSYQMGRAYGDRVRVHSYVPAGLFPWTRGLNAVKGEAFCHKADPVSLLGIHPDNSEFNFMRVLTEADRAPHEAHVRASGCDPTILLNVVSKHENERLIRKVLMVVHQICALPIFIFLSLHMLVKFTLIIAAAFLFWAIRGCPSLERPPLRV